MKQIIICKLYTTAIIIDILISKYWIAYKNC